MPGLTEITWILKCVSAFNLLQHVVVAEVYRDRLASPRYMSKKEGKF